MGKLLLTVTDEDRARLERLRVKLGLKSYAAVFRHLLGLEPDGPLVYSRELGEWVPGPDVPRVVVSTPVLEIKTEPPTSPCRPRAGSQERRFAATADLPDLGPGVTFGPVGSKPGSRLKPGRK